MDIGILGKKLGMTQVFDEDGRFIPVTVIEAGPCTVIQKKTVETDGYNALKVAYGDELKEKNIVNAHKGIFKKCGVPVKKHMKEFRTDDHKDYQVGQEIKVDIFKSGDYVDVSGISKGKGFQGVVKRWNFRGGKGTHGSMFHRRPGSIGMCAYPGKVIKGKKMPGRMGGKQRTVKGLNVVKVDVENNILVVRGPVPGYNGNYIFIKKDSFKRR